MLTEKTIGSNEGRIKKNGRFIQAIAFIRNKRSSAARTSSPPKTARRRTPLRDMVAADWAVAAA